MATSDPKTALSFLYRNDPFYSLYLSDLLAAPQWVKNKFLKEQKNLARTIRRLEHQKLSKQRQLDEEKRQFYLLMKKKLAPRDILRTASSTSRERDSQSSHSRVQMSAGASSKSSWKSLNIKPRPHEDTDFTSGGQEVLGTIGTLEFCQAYNVYFPNVPANVCKCLHSKKERERSESRVPFLSPMNHRRALAK